MTVGAAAAASGGRGRRLERLTAEQQVLCLGARTVVDEVADARLRRLLAGPLDWDRLWALGHLHDAIPLLGRSLPSRAGEAMPADWHALARKRTLATLRRNEILNAALARVLQDFATVGIEAMPVKGTVIAETVYGDLALRPAADVDVLVRPAQLPAARERLAALGYGQRPEPTFTALVHEFHDPPYYVGSPPDQVRLELHWALWAERFFHLGPERLWDRSVAGRVAGTDARLLSAEDTLLHLAIHRSRSGLRLRWVADIAELLRRQGAALDWDGLLARARVAGARTALFVVLDLADELLGSVAPAGVLERLRVSRFKRPLLERTCGATAMFREAAADDISQQPHLTLRVFEQDGALQIGRALASSAGRTVRKQLHGAGIRRVRGRAT